MTAYETIYCAFRDKVHDYDLMQFTDEEESEILHGYLKSAVARFGRICKSVSSYDDTKSEFPTELTDTEIEILAELMVAAWTKPKLYNSEKLRNSLSTKDYNFFSPANLLSQLRDINHDAEQRARAMMNEYSILNSAFSTLSTRSKS